MSYRRRFAVKAQGIPEQGVFILDNKGNFKTAEQWPQDQLGAVGVAVCSPERKLLIALKNSNDFTGEKWQYPSYVGLVDGCFTTKDESEALLDFDGEGNTEAIKISDTSFMTHVLGNFVWPKMESKIIQAPKAYIGSAGEWMSIYANENSSKIARCFNKLGKEQAYYPMGCWTSTQYDAETAWHFYKPAIEPAWKGNEFSLRFISKILPI